MISGCVACQITIECVAHLSEASLYAQIKVACFLLYLPHTYEFYKSIQPSIKGLKKCSYQVDKGTLMLLSSHFYEEKYQALFYSIDKFHHFTKTPLTIFVGVIQKTSLNIHGCPCVDSD